MPIVVQLGRDPMSGPRFLSRWLNSESTHLGKILLDHAPLGTVPAQGFSININAGLLLRFGDIG